MTSITPSAVLSPKTFRDVQFLLGIQQTINYRFAIIPETAPAMPTEALLISGNMDTGFDVESMNLEDIIRRFDVAGTNAVVQFTSSLIRNYRIQANTNLLNHAGWTNISGTIAGQYTTLTISNVNASITQRNFRITTTP